MARAPAVSPGVVLPDAPPQFDQANERETRRLLEEALRRLLDFNTIPNVPGNLQSLARLDGTGGDGLPYFSGDEELLITTLTAFGRVLIAAADAGAGRAVLGMPYLGTRVNVVLTTASLADAAAELGSVALNTKSASLLQIAADRACRVRLYSTDDARDADAARGVNTKAAPGAGLLAEFVFDAAGVIRVSPVATLTNDEATPQARVWYIVENKSGSPGTVAVTLTVLPLEI